MRQSFKINKLKSIIHQLHIGLYPKCVVVCIFPTRVKCIGMLEVLEHCVRPSIKVSGDKNMWLRFKKKYLFRITYIVNITYFSRLITDTFTS